MDRTYLCTSCSESTTIPYTYKSPSTFSCPKCKSIFKILTDRSLQYIGKFNGDVYDNYTYIGEKINYKGSEFRIVGISTKKSHSGKEKWNEYVAADREGNLKFLSHGVDFHSYLEEFDFKTVENQYINSKPIKYLGDTYHYSFESRATTYCGMGVFFNDISLNVRAVTFEEKDLAQKFLSIEEYSQKTEAFLGYYLEKNKFKSLFLKHREIQYVKSNVTKNIALLFALVSLVIGLLYFVINSNHLTTETYKGMVVKEPNQYEFIKTRSYPVTKDNQKVTIEFISETQSANSLLNIGLVNEKTNETHLIQGIIHFHNSKNFASGNIVEFCGIDKGDYHIVFHSNETNQTVNNIDIDYKISIGGTSLTWLYFTLFILVATTLIYIYLVLEKPKIESLQKFSNLIKYKNYQPLFIALFLIFIYVIGDQWFSSSNYCSNTFKNTQIEDATYSGSRSHYVHRVYSSGSHK